MEIDSKLLGKLTYSDDSIIRFDEGLIGITEKREFIFIEKEDFLPFNYLQSIDDPEFCLIVINPFFVEKNYQFKIAKDDLKQLGIQDDSDFFLLSIVVFANKIENITVNLRAPIVININTKQARQVLLLNDKYDIEEPLIKTGSFKAMLEQEQK